MKFKLFGALVVLLDSVGFRVNFVNGIWLISVPWLFYASNIKTDTDVASVIFTDKDTFNRKFVFTITIDTFMFYLNLGFFKIDYYKRFNWPSDLKHNRVEIFIDLSPSKIFTFKGVRYRVRQIRRNTYWIMMPFLIERVEGWTVESSDETEQYLKSGSVILTFDSYPKHTPYDKILLVFLDISKETDKLYNELVTALKQSQTDSSVD